MAESNLYGWDFTNSSWVKLQVDDEGKLIYSSVGLFEEVPTNGEVNKGPTSNWAYDHENDASAHHVKYTDAEAVAALESEYPFITYMDKSASANFNFNSGQVSINRSSGVTSIVAQSTQDALALTGRLRLSQGIRPSGYVSGTNITQNSIFDSLANCIQATNEQCFILGSIYHSGTLYHLSIAKRTSSTVIDLYGISDAGSLTNITITDGSATTVDVVSIAY